ncbi:MULTISPECIES: succinylglutamate desuccinylase/aspartoacylase family protein [unclassified Paludibacterium]|uniref:M14 family metallopeptidase n=1 Tax=unclassified Paludibacterium TaxID=2618429 RepID=UPI001C057FB3|nr:succinylglutamate desuccinylase/aspartoacylase family protein [Paludibacterium sp. B53371]BEV71879.1 succinylglutamate desuccinylase/aspartoacylase family protein [Paludibacterium sp. THUN1379]
MRHTILATCLALASAGVFAATQYTGDKIDGVPVISKLDVSDLPAGTVQHFWFQGVENAIGQHQYVPVMVAKGVEPGPRLGLQSGLHGDELNGTRTVQKVFDAIDPARLKGVVIGVVGANPTGMLANNRNFQLQNDGGDMTDPNRLWPGKEHKDAGKRHIWLLWNQLWGGNVDLFIDLHTQSRGTAYPLFVYTDARITQSFDMAKLIPADQIKLDPGEPGSAETTFDENKVPAITMEIGQAKLYETALIEKSYIGVMNVLVANHMLPGKLGKTSREAKTYFGNDMTSVRAEVGGFAEVLVALNQDVVKGQKIAVQRDAFGKVLKTYFAPENGRVLSIGTDPLREPGGLLVRLLLQNPAAECKLGC